MKEKLLKLYKRLLKVLESDKATDIVNCFKKFDDYSTQKLQDESLDGKFFTTLQVCSICHTVEALKTLGVNYRSLAVRWNSEAVQHCYELVKKLNKLASVGEKESDRFMILFAQFCRLIKAQEDAALQLYMHQVYKDSYDGADFYTSELKRENKLLQCNTEEEIDALLKSFELDKNEDKLKVQQQCLEASKG